MRSAPGTTVYCGALDPLKFGEDGAGNAVIARIARAGGRVTLQTQFVGLWLWRQERVDSLEALRALDQAADLDRTVLRLSLHMTVSLAERHAIEKILDRLRGTESTHGLVGIIESLDLSQLHIAPDLDQFPALPEILATAARRLAEQAGEADEAVVQRALYHLYQLVTRGQP